MCGCQAQAPTSARDLAYAFTDNLVPFEGAAGAFPTLSTPGNVSGFGTTAAQQATLYAVPTSGIAGGGQLTQMEGKPRQIQFALRLEF